MQARRKRWPSEWSETRTILLSSSRIVPYKTNQKYHPLWCNHHQHLTWAPYVAFLAKRVAKRLSILSRSRDLLPFKTRVTIYKAYIRPLMEYACPIWAGAGTTALGLLNRLQRKALYLLRIDDLIKVLIYPMSHLFAPSTDASSWNHPSSCLEFFPPFVFNVRPTRFSATAHPYKVTIPKSKANLHQSSYIPRTSRLWFSLTANIFPLAPNIEKFKNCANSYLICIL